jgi:hypothetical protein
MRQRWYDATLQRFVSRDPLRSSNRYAYVHNRPTSFIDPSGLAELYIYNEVLPSGGVVMVNGQTGADYVVAELSRLSGYNISRDPSTGLLSWNPNVAGPPLSATTRNLLDSIRNSTVKDKYGKNRYSIYLTQNRNCGDYRGNFTHSFDPRFIAWGQAIKNGVGSEWLIHELAEGWVGSLAGGSDYTPTHRQIITNYDNAVLNELSPGLVRLPDRPGTSTIYYNQFNVDFGTIPPVRR